MKEWEDQRDPVGASSRDSRQSCSPPGTGTSSINPQSKTQLALLFGDTISAGIQGSKPVFRWVAVVEREENVEKDTSEFSVVC